MSEELRFALIASVLALVVTAGLLIRWRSGKAKAITSGDAVDLAELAAIKDGALVTEFGKSTTLLQFSSEVCSACRATAKLYSQLEQTTDGLLHIEVDVTRRVDLANKYNILQTPTTLILDSRGRVKSRIGGAPKPNHVQAELESFEI